MKGVQIFNFFGEKLIISYWSNVSVNWDMTKNSMRLKGYKSIFDRFREL